jgi:4-amino-4-deoxy-L-arabinose transferase-like glycosyltransferase
MPDTRRDSCPPRPRPLRAADRARADRAVPRTWIIVLALAIGAMCWGRGYPLLEPDEGRNAEVAREMAREGDFVLPHLDGLPYLDKPATYFGTVAIALRVFGGSESAARLPSLLFTLGAVAIVWRLGRRMEGGAGAIAAIALITMPLVAAFSRTVIFDSALLFLETLTLYAAWRTFDGEPDSDRWAAFAWAVMGVGAIVKGPVAVIVPVLIVVAFGLAADVPLRPFFRLRSWPWLFATGLPWFIAVTLRRPDFPHYAFIYESLERVGTRTHGRAGPIWYFVPIALAASFPWCVPAIAAAARAWRSRSGRRAPESRAGAFLAAWALVPLILFSLSQSKLPGYYLPALPGIALAAGIHFSRAARARDGEPAAATSTFVAGILLLLLGALLVPAAAIASPHLPTELERRELPGFALAFGLVLGLAGLGAIAAAARRDVRVTVAALALPVIALQVTCGRLLVAAARGRSSYDMVRTIDAKARGATVVGVRAYPTTLRYYLDRPMLLSTASGGELTSNYVMSRLDEFRDVESSPLRPEQWWRERLDECPEPTVFVARLRTPEDTLLAARLPLIALGGADEKFAAYGPCTPSRPSPLAARLP